MSYTNYGYGVGYGTNPYYQGYQQPYQPNQFMNMNRQEQTQPMQNIETQARRVPFSEVLYGTLEQAKGRIVMPNMSVLFINPEKNEAYVSSTDQDGKPHFKTYYFSSRDNLSQDTQIGTTESNLFAKKEELGNFLTKKEAESFLTKQDLEEFNKKLEQLQKKIQINKMFEEGNK